MLLEYVLEVPQTTGEVGYLHVQILHVVLVVDFFQEAFGDGGGGRGMSGLHRRGYHVLVHVVPVAQGLEDVTAGVGQLNHLVLVVFWNEADAGGVDDEKEENDQVEESYNDVHAEDVLPVLLPPGAPPAEGNHQPVEHVLDPPQNTHACDSH